MVNHSVNEALSEVEVDLGFFLHEYLKFTFVDLFALDLEKLSEVGLRTATHSLNLALCKGVQDRLSLSVDVVDKEVLACRLDVVDLALKDE